MLATEKVTLDEAQAVTDQLRRKGIDLDLSKLNPEKTPGVWS